MFYTPSICCMAFFGGEKSSFFNSIWTTGSHFIRDYVIADDWPDFCMLILNLADDLKFIYCQPSLDIYRKCKCRGSTPLSVWKYCTFPRVFLRLQNIRLMISLSSIGRIFILSGKPKRDLMPQIGSEILLKPIFRSCDRLVEPCIFQTL